MRSCARSPFVIFPSQLRVFGIQVGVCHLEKVVHGKRRRRHDRSFGKKKLPLMSRSRGQSASTSARISPVVRLPRPHSATHSSLALSTPRLTASWWESALFFFLTQAHTAPYYTVSIELGPFLTQTQTAPYCCTILVLSLIHI